MAIHARQMERLRLHVACSARKPAAWLPRKTPLENLAMTTERQKLLIELRGLREREQNYQTQLERTRIRAGIIEQKIRASEPVKEQDFVKIGN